MSDEPTVGAFQTDPPAGKAKSNKAVVVGGLIVFLVLWVVWASMRKPGAVSIIQDLSEMDQQPLVLADGQGEAGLGQSTVLTDAIKEGQNKEPIPMGRKGVWYTFYPPSDKDEAIKKEVKGGNGWTVKSAGEETYIWKGKYEIKLRAPATSPGFPIGIEFFEHEMGIGDQIGMTLKNMLP